MFEAIAAPPPPVFRCCQQTTVSPHQCRRCRLRPLRDISLNGPPRKTASIVTKSSATKCDRQAWHYDFSGPSKRVSPDHPCGSDRQNLCDALGLPNHSPSALHSPLMPHLRLELTREPSRSKKSSKVAPTPTRMGRAEPHASIRSACGQVIRASTGEDWRLRVGLEYASGTIAALKDQNHEL